VPLPCSENFKLTTSGKLSIILEREASKWFKPAKGQFQIYYKSGADHLEYQPTSLLRQTARFTVGTEAPRRNEGPDVLAKKEVAIGWCTHASDHAKTYRGKPWKYLLIRTT